MLRDWLRQRVTMGVSVIAWAEFVCGPVSEIQRDLARRIVGLPVPLVEEDALRAAALFNDGGRRRGSLPDCLIAAAALRADAALATSNPRDFLRFARTAALVVATV